MTNANLQALSSLSFLGRVLIMAGAGLLFLVSLALQIGMLGYSHFQPGNLWIVSTILERAWSMLIGQLYSLGAQWLVTFWPLPPISFGLAILLLIRSEGKRRAPSASSGGQNHGQ